MASKEGSSYVPETYSSRCTHASTRLGKYASSDIFLLAQQPRRLSYVQRKRKIKGGHDRTRCNFFSGFQKPTDRLAYENLSLHPSLLERNSLRFNCATLLRLFSASLIYSFPLFLSSVCSFCRFDIRCGYKVIVRVLPRLRVMEFWTDAFV